jgi:thiamine pyrophosphate-dependent acetolactate synthase large subunit-like protein
LQQERPGPVHLELPEDIAGGAASDVPLATIHPIDLPIAHPAAMERAAELIPKAARPLVMLGAAASRPRLADALSDFVKRLQISFFNTQMGKGSVAGGSGLYMGTATLSERDYVHRAIDHADLIIAIGHDTVEKPPFLMGPDGPTVLHVGYLPATVEEVFFPHAELVGDVGPSVALLADRLEGKLPNAAALLGLREDILAQIAKGAEEARYPLTPQRIVHGVRNVMPEDGGAIYADRLAKRGYDLILVARNQSRLAALAQRLKNETGRSVETITADLNDNADPHLPATDHPTPTRPMADPEISPVPAQGASVHGRESDHAGSDGRSQ